LPTRMSRQSSADQPSCGAASAKCFICDQSAVGVGPLSGCHLCDRHLELDVSQKVKLDVAEQRRAYLRERQNPGAISSASNATEPESDVARLRREVCRNLFQVNYRFDLVQQGVESLRGRVTGQLEGLLGAVQNEQQQAADTHNLAELFELMQSINIPHASLDTDFETNSLGEQTNELKLQLRLLGQLERLVGICARPRRNESYVVLEASRSYTSEVKLDGLIEWLAVCSDTSGFFGDPSGRVVRGNSVNQENVPLSQPCVFALINHLEDHLLVVSLDGSQKLRCYCDLQDWNGNICGLHCDRQLLFIAQDDTVTVTDLSGRALRQIRPDIESFGKINGIGGNAASVFVSSGNKIAAFSKATGQIETVITLSQLPHAGLGNLTTHDNCILVTDWNAHQVHRVRIDTEQLVASLPNPSGNIRQFGHLKDVAVDRRGRLFISEWKGHSVRALTVDDGLLLWSMGTPGESGSGKGSLEYPCGLSMLTDSHCERLVIADYYNSRLLIVNVH
ncbi:hypothetical protein BOX15_Mlig014813g2, partial [Macrostomum lignano]